MTKPDRLWDWLARRYDRQARSSEANDWGLERLGKYVGADGSVLDYGCGSGVVPFQIASRVAEVHGIDTSTKMIEIANRRLAESGIENVRFLRGTIFDHRLQREYYDLTLAFNVLHLVGEPSAAVERAAELLKPGGVLVATVPCVGDAPVALRMLLRWATTLRIVSYLQPITVAGFRQTISDAGLRVVESAVEEHSIPNCLVIAQKSLTVQQR